MTVCKEGSDLIFVATDAKGRSQYRYTNEHTVGAEQEKIQKLALLTPSFWRRFHDVVNADLHSGTGKQYLLAVMASLLQSCKFRPGGKEDVEGHFGLTTLECGHYDARRRAFSFVGKAGKVNQCVLDESLHARVKNLVRGKDARARLFSTPDGSPVTVRELRSYLSVIGPIRPKDFRTYFANQSLLHYLVKHPPLLLTRSQRAAALKTAYSAISAGLNNTPAVSKKSYVFTGFSVAYALRPVLFSRLLKETEGRSPSECLVHFVQAFKGVDWRAML